MRTLCAKSNHTHEGDFFPFVQDNNEIRQGRVKYHRCDETLYACWQPDCLDDEEFNTVIILEGVPVLVRSIHFDFVEVDL